MPVATVARRIFGSEESCRVGVSKMTIVDNVEASPPTGGVVPQTEQGQMDNQRTSEAFPTAALRLDRSLGGWAMFNRDSGFEMTGGTWILSSDMEIVGGPLSAATGFDTPKVPSGPKHTSTPKKNAANIHEDVHVDSWLDSPVSSDADEVEDPPEDSREFQPSFNSTFALSSLDSPLMNVDLDYGQNESVIVASSYCLRPRKTAAKSKSCRKEVLKKPKAGVITEPFSLTKMVEEFEQLSTATKLRTLSQNQSPIFEEEVSEVSTQVKLTSQQQDSGIEDSPSIKMEYMIS